MVVLTKIDNSNRSESLPLECKQQVSKLNDIRKRLKIALDQSRSSNSSPNSSAEFAKKSILPDKLCSMPCKRTSQNNETTETPVLKNPSTKAREARRPSNSSQDSCAELARKSIMQEMLFSLQCKKMNQKDEASGTSALDNSVNKLGLQNYGRRQVEIYKKDDLSLDTSRYQSESNVSNGLRYEEGLQNCGKRQMENHRQGDSNTHNSSLHSKSPVSNLVHKTASQKIGRKQGKNCRQNDLSSSSSGSELNQSRQDNLSSKNQVESYFLKRRPKKYYNPNDNLGSNAIPHQKESHLYGRNEGGNCSLDDESNSDSVPMSGVLHMKEPLKNQNNESIYYDSRGRMEPMDWSVVNNDRKTSSDERNSKNNSNRREENQNNIEKLSETKPETTTEYLNYIKNSVTYKTVYDLSNNLEQFQNSVDSPISKIQRKIKNNHKNSISVTKEIKKYFEPSQRELQVIDVIDSIALVRNRETETSKVEENLSSKIKLDVKEDLILKETLKSRENLALKSSLPQNEVNRPLDMNDYNTTDYWNTLLPSSQGKKEMFEDFDDNMIVFTEAVQKESTSIIKNEIKPDILGDCCGDDTLSFMQAKPLSRSSSITSSLTNSPNSYDSETRLSTNSSTSRGVSTNSLFNKLKSTCKETSCISLDSDDATEKGTIVGDLSFSKSTSSKLKKVKNAATQYSPMKLNGNIQNENLEVEQKNDIILVKEKTEEFLIKEAHTRYFNKSSNNRIVDESNSEVTKPKITTEEFLKVISTRYFSKQQILDAEVLSNQKKTEISIIGERSSVENVKQENVLSSQDASKETKLFVKEKAREESSIEKSECTSEPKQVEEITVALENTSCDSREDMSFENDTECDVIYHTHENDKKCPGIIQEILSNSEESVNEEDSKISTTKILLMKSDESENEEDSKISTQKMLPMRSDESENEEDSKISTKKMLPMKSDQDYEAFYSDINPDEEFDIVNVEQFEAIQKIIKLCKMNNDSVNSKSSSNSRSIESSFEISENKYSNVSASVSSNLDTDYDTSSTSRSSPDFLSAKQNVFANIEIDTNQLKCLDYNDNASKSEPVISNRKKKMMNALNNYQKSADTGEECEKAQQQVDSTQHESLENEEILKSHQILKEIKKRKLHLSCKPLMK